MNEVQQKDTNLLKNKLVNEIILYVIAFIVLFFMVFYYILPDISDIKAKQEILKTDINYFDKITKNGISFDEFNNYKNSVKNIVDTKELGLYIDRDSFSKNLISSIDKDFYNNYFTNKTGENYKSFLLKLDKDIGNTANSREFKLEKEKIGNLLPIYSDSMSTGVTVIDDSRFINKIENLIEKFNLVSDNSVNIGNLVLVDDVVEGEIKTNTNSTESEIYYFLVPLNIKGAKRDIINFIHYLENSAAIKIDGNNIISYKDNFIYPNFQYDGMLTEIESIKISEYIDSNNMTTANEMDFVTFLKNNQGEEELQVNLDVKFFVKGLALYKVQEFVKETQNKYNNLFKNINLILGKINQKDPKIFSIFTKLNQTKKYLENIKKDIFDLVKNSKDKDKLSDVNNSTYKISSELSFIESYLENNKALIKELIPQGTFGLIFETNKNK